MAFPCDQSQMWVQGQGVSAVAQETIVDGLHSLLTKGWTRKKHEVDGDPIAARFRLMILQFLLLKKINLRMKAPLRSDGATSSFIGYQRGSVAARGVAAMHAAWSRTRALCLQICSMRRELHLRAH